MERFAARRSVTSLRAAAATPIEALFYAHDQRVAHKWHHYLAIYDEVLAPYRTGFPLPDGSKRPLRLLEIGVSEGGSLQMWRKYFAPDTAIFGIDIDPACARAAESGFAVRIGSQADPDFLRRVVAEMGGVDIVLDDGSHVASHQRVSFATLFPELSLGGLYIAEDLHSSYWKNFEGGYKRHGTFIELAKSLVDDIHGWYHDCPPGYPPAQLEIRSIRFFDSMVVIEKQARDRPFHIKVGGRTINRN